MRCVLTRWIQRLDMVNFCGFYRPSDSDDFVYKPPGMTLMGRRGVLDGWYREEAVLNYNIMTVLVENMVFILHLKKRQCMFHLMIQTLIVFRLKLIATFKPCCCRYHYYLPCLSLLSINNIILAEYHLSSCFRISLATITCYHQHIKCLEKLIMGHLWSTF